MWKKSGTAGQITETACACGTSCISRTLLLSTGLFLTMIAIIFLPTAFIIVAVRTAIANSLVNFSKDAKLKQAYLDYDRALLISDARRTEPHKPSRSKDGPRASKKQSKR